MGFILLVISTIVDPAFPAAVSRLYPPSNFYYCKSRIQGLREHSHLSPLLISTIDWFIEMFEYGLLQDAGKVSAEIAKIHVETEFEKYRVIQDKLFLSDYDRFLLELQEKSKKVKTPE